VSWQLAYTKQAQKDAKKLAAAGLQRKAEELLKLISENPLQTPPLSKSWSEIFKAHTLEESTFTIALSIRFTRIRKWSRCCECGLTTNDDHINILER
jgi:hypothetical protein